MTRNTARKGKIVAVANMKGGVGKSTTVVSIAEALAADDLKSSILVVDLDPQASASVCVAGDNLLYELIQADRTLEFFLDKKLLMQEEADLHPLIRDQISALTHQGKTLDLSLLPCGPRLRVLERELIYDLAGRGLGLGAIDDKIWKLFEEDFGRLRDIYDYILFDCAPGLSPIGEAAVRIADLVIVPTIPDFLSVYGLNAFHGSIWTGRFTTLPKPKSDLFILITRMLRTKQHMDMCENLTRNSKSRNTYYRLLETRVPQVAALADALLKSGHLTYTKKYTSSLIDETLTPLVREIKELL